MTGCTISVHQSNLLEMEIIENRTRRFFRQSPPWVAFEVQLDPSVSGMDRTILLTSGVSTKAEWVMACPSLKKKLWFGPLLWVRAATTVSLSSRPSGRCYICRFVGPVYILKVASEYIQHYPVLVSAFIRKINQVIFVECVLEAHINL